MKTIEINTFDDLLDFIKLDEVTIEQAYETISKVLSVVMFDFEDKNKLIEATEIFIETYCRNNQQERPIFLTPLSDLSDDQLRKLIAETENKKIVDDLEAKY